MHELANRTEAAIGHLNGNRTKLFNSDYRNQLAKMARAEEGKTSVAEFLGPQEKLVRLLETGFYLAGEKGMKAAVGRRGPPSKLQITKIYDATAGYWDSFIQRAVYGHAYVGLLRHLRVEHWFDPLRGSIRVLDCGTGSGLLLTSLIKAMGRRPMELFGIDLSTKMLDHARRRLTAQGAIPELGVADVCSLPFRDCEMDLVMGALVLEHVAEPVVALREMMRVVRPNARLVLVTTRPHAPDVLYRLVFRYRHFRYPQLLTWMGEAGIREICSHQLAGIARWFGHAFVGRKPE